MAAVMSCETLYNAQVTNDPLCLVLFVTLAMQPSEVPRSRLSKREHCPQRKRLKKTHVRVSLSRVHVNQKKKKKKKTGSGGTRSVLPRFSPIPSFTYSNYSVDYPSICPGQRRAFRES